MAIHAARVAVSAKATQPPAPAAKAVRRPRGQDAAADGGPDAARRAVLNARPPGPRPVQRAARPNRTGLPDRLKAGVEALSGLAMDDVKVHYDSPRPRQLQAHAFTQGSEIHVGPGQERHLPHEAWHVVQQKQGRVRATRQLKAGAAINDDAGLEREADAMGARALRQAAAAGGTARAPATVRPGGQRTSGPIQRYTVEGQYHVSDDRTAAVIDAKNNKTLLATGQRVDQANALLEQRVSNIRLVAGAAGNDQLRPVTAQVHSASVKENALEPNLGPVHDAGGEGSAKVLLPSECEKGAVGIIGAFLRAEAEDQNPIAYDKGSHAEARIANILAQTRASSNEKKEKFAEWKRLTGLTANVTKVYNQFAHAPSFPNSEEFMAARGEVRITNPRVADDNFQAKFARKEDRWEPRVERLEAGTALEHMVKVLDMKVGFIEQEAMSDIDAHYRDAHRNVLEAHKVRLALKKLYEANKFPKAIVDRALALAGRQGERDKFFVATPGDAESYANNLNYLSGYRMQSFLEELVTTISTEITRLEAERDKKFGSDAKRNRAVDPDVGEAYGIIGGGYDFKRGGRWNWHWAGVIMKTPTDNITMEAHASHKQGEETHNARWDFKMYGRPHAAGGKATTFHDRWRDQGFGLAPVTVRGKPVGAVEPSVGTFKLMQQGFTLIQVAKYRKGAKDLSAIIAWLQEAGRGKEEIVKYHADKTDAVVGLCAAELPKAFVDEWLKASLKRLDDAVTDLKQAGAEKLEAAGEAVRDAARRLVLRLDLYSVALDSYQHAGKKIGSLV